MSRPLKLLAVCLIAVALSLPATALGASTSKRAQLTNITSTGALCSSTGAIKGGAHEGSVKFTPDGAGNMGLTVVLRHALPYTQYGIWLWAACGPVFVDYVNADSSGNGTFTGSVFYGSGTGFWAELDAPGGADVLATAVVTF